MEQLLPPTIQYPALKQASILWGPNLPGWSRVTPFLILNAIPLLMHPEICISVWELL